MVDPRLALALAGVLALLMGLFFWPRAGLYWRWRRLQTARARVWVEDALKHLYHCEARQITPTLDSVAGAVGIGPNDAAELVGRLENMNLLRADAEGWRLTPEGRRDALRMIRFHRVYERYLADYTSFDEVEWHDEADRREHTLSAEEIERLAAEMGHPRFDPHGAPIPTLSGDMPPALGESLAAFETGDAGMITRVEDEPSTLYAQLIAQGVGVGAQLRVLEKTPTRMRLEIDGDEQILAPVVAARVMAMKIAAPAASVAATARLADVPVGELARVVGIAPGCRGVQRRRLLDLGLVPGTVVSAELSSLGGNPTAYRIRGALIALRRAQAEQIQVSEVTAADLARGSAAAAPGGSGDADRAAPVRVNA